MIDFGLRRGAVEIPEREIRQLAQAWVNEPQMQRVALRIAQKCHVPPGLDFAEFRAELAILAAEQYLQGRATGRAKIIVPPEMPKVREDIDSTKPYEVNDPRWKPPTMRQG